jgi:hypothetical protein
LTLSRDVTKMLAGLISRSRRVNPRYGSVSMDDSPGVCRVQGVFPKK